MIQVNTVATINVFVTVNMSIATVKPFAVVRQH